MTKEKSLFEDDEIVDDRTKRIIDGNYDLGNRYVESQPETVKKKSALNSLINKPKIEKGTYGYYIDDKIDVFITKMAKTTKYSKSEVVNQLMTLLITESDIMKELAESSDGIQKIVDEFKS